MEKLRTDRSAFTFYLRAGITFGLLYVVDSYALAKDMNTIMTRYDGKTTKPERLLLPSSKDSVFGGNARERINNELKRRGIDFQISRGFKNAFEIFKALNLLSEDYNRTGC
ncbi:MAG: hypothetical protein J6D19_04145 [Clostridia bacterium]|nr:hypothetical protein [Clostridia bacterium]